MQERLSIPDTLIIDCLKTSYGIQAETLKFLPIGADMNASLYKAQGAKDSYFIKLRRGHHPATCVRVVELLHKAGVRQVIPTIKTVHGGHSQHIGDCTLIVYPFIEGQNGFNRRLTDHQWIELGKALRQVHELEVPSSIRSQVRKETYSPKWQEAMKSFYTHLDAEPVDDIASNLLKFMKKHFTAICRLVDKAGHLSQKVRNYPPQFVLCHSDIHAGNVLLTENDEIYIVDWDEPILAPKERDLMFIGGGVGNVWNQSREEELFYKGYGKTEIDPTLLAYYRHERIVEDMAIYARALLLTTDGGEDRLEMYKHFIAMFEPRGVVDLAFQTNEGLRS